MVKVPEKFSALTLAVPDRMAVKVPVPDSPRCKGHCSRWWCR
jgi:hypothetical protein